MTLGLATPEGIAASPNFGSIVISANLRISATTIVTILANILIMIGLTLFTGHTKMGKAMRAVSEDRGAAELMGISVNRTITLTFAIGSALAAIAGVLLCSSYQVLQPTTGSMPGIKAFTAAVFGGIGSIPGAMIGGIFAGRHRDPRQRLCLHAAGRRVCLCGADRGAAGQAHRPVGQESQRESVR